MIEKPDPRARLLAEAFTDDWSTGPAAALAHRAAAHARRRSTLRRALTAGGALCALLAVFFLTARLRLPPNSPALPQPEPMAKASPSFEIISDEELMTALRNRPLLVLPQETGARKFVLLDR